MVLKGNGENIRTFSQRIFTYLVQLTYVLCTCSVFACWKRFHCTQRYRVTHVVNALRKCCLLTIHTHCHFPHRNPCSTSSTHLCESNREALRHPRWNNVLPLVKAGNPLRYHVVAATTVWHSVSDETQFHRHSNYILMEREVNSANQRRTFVINYCHGRQQVYLRVCPSAILSSRRQYSMVISTSFVSLHTAVQQW